MSDPVRQHQMRGTRKTSRTKITHDVASNTTLMLLVKLRHHP